MRTYLEHCFERAEAQKQMLIEREMRKQRIWRATAGKWQEIAQNAMCNQVSHDRWVSGVIRDES